MLAGIISGRYKQSRNESARHSVMKKIKPEIDRRLTAGAWTSAVFLELRVRLGDFDFERKEFSTRLGPRSFWNTSMDLQ